MNIESAISVFVEGHSRTRSRNHSCEGIRVFNAGAGRSRKKAGGIWCLRDVPRSRAADYRKEEWIGWRVAPRLLHETALAGTRGRYFLGAVVDPSDESEQVRAEYRSLGYRLLTSEQLFVHDLRRIPRRKSAATIERLESMKQAAEFARATRTRPLTSGEIVDGSFRQYLARIDDQLVGWVRSVATSGGSWVSNLQVLTGFRRQGIGSALMARMLHDDRRAGVRQSVLLASHTGALLYPHLGYLPLGKLLIYAPRRDGSSAQDK